MAAPTRNLNRLALFEDLGYKPHPGQLAIHRSQANRRVVACGVRWGKTKCAAMEAIAASLAPKAHSIGWCVAPTYDLADRVFREIQVTLLEQLRHRIIKSTEHDRRILLRNMAGGVSEIRGKSADNPVSLLGEGLDWVIVDEAARLKPTIWESHLSQRLIDKQGWALLISTPKGKGYFHDLFLRGQQGRDPDYESWNHPSWTNPYLDRAVIEAERERLPERTFAQEYEGQFVEGSGAVFRYVRECATGTFEGPVPGKRYVAGLDLAKVQDWTVLALLSSDRRIVLVDRFHRLDWGLQVARIRATLLRYDAPVMTDTTGVGDPIHESLCLAGLLSVPYPFTAKSKAALIQNLSMLLEQKAIVLPSPQVCPELTDELESFQYSVTDSGNVRSGAPSGVHDDIVIAVALAAWALKPRQKVRRLVQFIDPNQPRNLRIAGRI